MSARVPQPRPVGGEADPVLAELEQHARTTRDDRRALKVALTAAVAFHVALLAVRVPADEKAPPPEPPQLVPHEVVDVTLVPQQPRPPIVEELPTEEEVLIHFPVPEIFAPAVEALPNTVLADEDLGQDIVAPPAVAVPAPSDEEPQRPWQIGVDPPVKVHNVDPVYPPMAQRVNVGGVVILDAVIGRDGSVRDVRVLRPGVLGMTEAAVEAVRQWRYDPTLVNDRPVEVVVTVTVTFRIQRP